MVAIELTEEHKEKLFEMCKKLFPEYKWENGNFFRKGHLDIYKWGTEMCPDWPIYSHSIHWFEFCLTHLAEKVINPKGENDSTIRKNFEEFFIHMKSYSWFIQDPGLRESFAKHPIDYLYEQFKKLKQIDNGKKSKKAKYFQTTKTISYRK